MFIVLPVLVVLHILVCLLIIFVVLMQRPRSEGLGAAFGGGVTENIFGAQTTHVLAKFTTWLALAFFVITLLLSILTAKTAAGKTAIQKSLLDAPIPQAALPPSPSSAGSTTPAAPVPPVAPPASSPAN
jgi:preprotein translocase subunit SecG